MLSVVCWKWGRLFSALYVNRLRSALARHLALPHQLFCVTDDPAGIDARVVVVPMPETYGHTPRCRRRMQQWSAQWAAPRFGRRMLAIDLDVVILGDLTPLVDRPEPIVGWRVGHAGCYSGSFLLADVGALDGAWAAFEADPDGYPQRAWPSGVGSDQAMLNYWLRGQPAIASWTERDGLVTYYGRGYERYEHLGVGPNRPALPPGARIVVLGSADLGVLVDGSPFAWVREHWR